MVSTLHAPQRRGQLAGVVAWRRRLYPEARDHARGHDLDFVPPRTDRESPHARSPRRPSARRRRRRWCPDRAAPDGRRHAAQRIMPTRSAQTIMSERICPSRTPAAGNLPAGRSLRPFALTMPRVLLIGSSTGGPQALTALIEKLPAAIDRAPVLITQHMPPTFTTVLAEHLSRVGGRGAHEAEAWRAGPGRRHLCGARAAGICASCATATRVQIALGDDAPINFCKPAVDRAVHLGGGGLGLGDPGAHADRHGHGRHPRRRRSRRGGRQRHRPGRGDQRGLGHAALGGAGRPVLRRAAARSDRTESAAPVCRETARDAAGLRFPAQMPQGALRPRAVGRQAVPGRKPAAAGRAQGRSRQPWRPGRPCCGAGTIRR